MRNIALLAAMILSLQAGYAAPSVPNYIPGTRLEGEAEMFGQWEFEVTSLTRDEASIHPVTTKISVCLVEGMEEKDIPLRAEPRLGRCIIHSNRFAKDGIDLSFNCDEGDDIAGMINFTLALDEDGSYKGNLDYSVSPLDADYQINSYSYITAKHMGACETQ